MTRKIFALAIVAAAVGVVSAQAATITINLTYNTTWTAGFGADKGPVLGALPAPAAGVPVGVVPSDIHQFSAFMNITGLAAGEDLETAVFDVVLGPGVTPNLEAGSAYTGDNPLYDPPPNTTNGCASGCLSVLGNNQDAGSNVNDLKAITLVANSASTFQGTHTRHPGEAEPGATDTDNATLANMFLGTIYVNWDGTGGTSFIGVVDPANVASPLTTRSSTNVAAAYGAGSMEQGPNLQWGIPEPTSVTLLGLAIFGSLGFLRRR